MPNPNPDPDPNPNPNLNSKVRCGDRVGTCGGGLVRSGVAWLAASVPTTFVSAANDFRPTWLSHLFEGPPGELATALLACAIKVTLLALPALAAAQWGLRAAQAMRGINAIKAVNGLAASTVQVGPAAATSVTGAQARRTTAQAMRGINAIKAVNGQAGPPAGAHGTAGPAGQAAARLPMLQEQLWLSAAMLACTLRLVAFVLVYELNGLNSSLGGFLLVVLAGCLFESLPMWKTRPILPASAAQAADWPRLAEARGSLEHNLALKEAPGAPVGRGLSHLVFHIGRCCRPTSLVGGCRSLPSLRSSCCCDNTYVEYAA